MPAGSAPAPLCGPRWRYGAARAEGAAASPSQPPQPRRRHVSSVRSAPRSQAAAAAPEGRNIRDRSPAHIRATLTSPPSLLLGKPGSAAPSWIRAGGRVHPGHRLPASGPFRSIGEQPLCWVRASWQGRHAFGARGDSAAISEEGRRCPPGAASRLLRGTRGCRHLG